jgi:hypothetical protein
MSISLGQILNLVGNLDDSPGDDTPRERFRTFLKKNVLEVGQLRDYIQECLRTPGDQYARTLQDLVNHLGGFLGFEVIFGRYKGVQRQPGFDGLWISPSGMSIVVEVKTTETYAIKTATLLGYINELVSTKEIPDRESALGLYVVGRPDPEILQLEHAITAEKVKDQLRVISAESLLSLGEMMNQYDVNHEHILTVLSPFGAKIDPLVELMERITAAPPEPPVEEPVEEGETPEPKEVCHWLTPVKDDEFQTAEDCVRSLVGQEGIYAFGERTPGRKRIKPGDWICFYATATGVVGHARVKSCPKKTKHRKVRHPEQYPWVFEVDRTSLYVDEVVVIDAEMRGRLDAFKGRDLSRPWAWFVQATRGISKHDFELLTSQGKTSSG